MISLTDIEQAIARGYCHAVNEKKVLDPELVALMSAEVMAALQAKEPTVTDTQRLKAEIAAIEQRMPTRVSYCTADAYNALRLRLRQLSAV